MGRDEGVDISMMSVNEMRRDVKDVDDGRR
jgi:hypothetical protein